MLKKFINLFMNTKEVTNLKEGTVKFFNTTKGFGFISSKDSDTDIFVHSTNLIDKIKQNDLVTFDVQKGEKGLTAVKVRLA
jgi:cold shock protein